MPASITKPQRREIPADLKKLFSARSILRNLCYLNTAVFTLETVLGIISIKEWSDLIFPLLCCMWATITAFISTKIR